MAYENISGGNVWKKPSYRKQFTKDWQAGENFKIKGILNDVTEVDVVEATISAEDRADFGPNDQLHAIMRIDFVKVTVPPAE